MPARKKGRRYPVEISGVAWIDLLGYGAMLRKARFDPTHPDAEAAVYRLRLFQKTAAKHAFRHMQALIINDGVAYVRELSPRTSASTFDFLKRINEAYLDINSVDNEHGHPGARMVVATGPRMRIDGVTKYCSGHLKSIILRWKQNKISAKQAIQESFKSLPITGSVTQLQANFAFTRAYLAESSGSKGGFGGPNLFVDHCFFDDPPPEWLGVKKSVAFNTEGINASFFQVDQIAINQVDPLMPFGVLNAIDIADRLKVDYLNNPSTVTTSP